MMFIKSPGGNFGVKFGMRGQLRRCRWNLNWQSKHFNPCEITCCKANEGITGKESRTLFIVLVHDLEDNEALDKIFYLFFMFLICY